MWKTNELPGNTLSLSIPGVPGFKNNCSLIRPPVLITTCKITLSNIFNHGLYQNIIIIYRLLENMGYKPYLLINCKLENGDFPDEWKDIRCLTIEDFIAKPFQIIASIEIGMSLDTNIRSFFKKLGAKNVKLYLGNVLNIDVETSIFHKNADLAHHVIGDTDELWVSPHYSHHLEYTCVMNRVCQEAGALAPYVWDPMILQASGFNNSWKVRGVNETTNILIFEPNISFQKTCVVPLAICEAYYNKNPEADIKVHLFNCDRFNVALYFKESILKNTKLARDGKVELHGRESVVKLMEKYPSGIILCHQIANEFNYMILECLYSGFPVIHNAKTWKEAGYYYEGNDITNGVDGLNQAINNHEDNLAQYKSAGAALLWKHSIHNPEVKREWENLLLRKVKEN